jgi:hypothetical protein
MWWMKRLKFLDGYAAGLRRSVNMMTWKLNGLKSHDYHIIMERLLHVMFRGYFDDAMWIVLAELSYFYRQLCAKQRAVEMMQKLEKEIPVVLCKMEKNFPPDFFNPMQHLLIHLPYEAKVGGRKIFLLIFSIQCNISLYISHMKQKWVVLFSIGGCITLKETTYILNQWLAIEQGLKGESPKHLFLRR